MGKIQKVYTKEFKEEAVRLAETSGKPIAQIARELGISDSAIKKSLSFPCQVDNTFARGTFTHTLAQFLLCTG